MKRKKTRPKARPQDRKQYQILAEMAHLIGSILFKEQIKRFNRRIHNQLFDAKHVAEDLELRLLELGCYVPTKKAP